MNATIYFALSILILDSAKPSDALWDKIWRYGFSLCLAALGVLALCAGRTGV